MKVSHTYAALTEAEVAQLLKVNAEKLIGQYGDFITEHRWVSQHRLEGKGRGVTAAVYIDGRSIVVEGALPFALRLFRGKIEAVVRRKLASLE